MPRGKTFRCWILGLSCVAFPLAGCAQPAASSSGGLLSWFRSRPLSERERERLERQEAAGRLQDPANLHLKYAQWRENVGDYADARQSYQSALKENPKSLEAKVGLARLDQLAGRIAEAEEGFQNALKSRPGDPLALNALGQFYASQKSWNKALPLLEEAADGAPHELAFRYHLAVALAQSGDIDAAFPHFKQAVGDAEAHYNIGYLLYEKGHPDLARHQFQQALKLNPKLVQAQALLDELNPKPIPKDTELAQAPITHPPVSPSPIQQASAAPLPPVRRVEQAIATEPVATGWAPVNPSGHLPQAAPVSTQAPQAMPEQFSAAPVQNPPAFQTPPAAPVQNAPEFQSPAAAPNSNWQPAVQDPPAAQYPPAVETPPAAQNPPAFRPTRKQNWSQTEASHHASEFLPPYSPEATMESDAQGPALTPPITPAQREQWENQMKATP